MEGLAAAGSVVAVLEIAVEITRLCSGYIHDVRHASQDIQRLLSKVSALSDVLKKLQETAQLKDSGAIIVQCVNDLGSIKEKLEPSKGRRAAKFVGIRALRWPFTSKEVEEKVRLVENYLLIFNTSLQLNIGHRMASAEEERLLEKLSYVSDAPLESYENRRHRPCLENTRVKVLEDIMQWATGTSPQYIFWLKGLAGYGKSTVAVSVASKLKKISPCQASFFFNRGFGDLAHTRKLIPTLVRQLIRGSTAYRDQVLEIIKKEPDLGQTVNLRDQFEKLVIEPLRKLGSSATNTIRFFIIIDALDECDDESDLRILLRLFATTKDVASLQLRIVVTSRPEWVILQGFQNMPRILHRDLVLNDVPRTIVNSDIETFMRHELQRVQQDRDLPLPWPQEADISTLVSKAAGFFIFANTACRYIAASPLADPQERLEQICKNVGHNHLMTKEVDQMYTIVLQNSIKGTYTEEERQRIVSYFRRVVGSIVVLLTPLPILELYKLLQNDEVADQLHFGNTLRSLYAVIDVPEDVTRPLLPLHLSFRDFLLDNGRCLEAQFQINEQETHRTLAADCVRLLSTSLRRNMCCLPSAGTFWSEITQSEIDAALSPAVKYASRYWAAHLQKGEVELIDNDYIHDFLGIHFLHWLEAMSLMGRTSEAIITLAGIAAMVNSLRSPILYDLVHDYQRFLLAFRQAIASAPGQLYESALFFSPLQSTVRKMFSDAIPKYLRVSPPIRERWSASLQTLEGHYGPIYTVSFSPNGQLLASASGDHTVRVWDTKTGDSRVILKGHSDDVRGVLFSPDGQFVASASADQTVRLWDVQTGDSRATLKSDLERIPKMIFFPDGQLMTLTSFNCTLRLCNVLTGDSRTIFRGYFTHVTNVAFSFNGRLIALASDNDAILLWNMQTDDVRIIHKGYSDLIGTIVFSSDSQLIALGSQDNAIYVYQTQTGDAHAVLKGHSDGISAIAFSPDDRLVASASHDGTMRLWDVLEGDFLTVLKGHVDLIYSVIFSPNGQFVASGSWDGTVRLWEAQTGGACAILDAHSSAILSIAFSSDSQFIASGSSDFTVRLWKVQADNALATPKDHSADVTRIVFSPDDQLVATGSHNGTVRLWEAQTGKSRAILKGHSDMVSDVVFSPNGQLVVSASHDSTVRIWEAQTGNSNAVLNGHSDLVKDVQFSPNGQYIASASLDSTTRLWNTQTGDSHAVLKGHSNNTPATRFSPDGQIVASWSRGLLKNWPPGDDNTVRLWNVQTGGSYAVFEGHSNTIYDVVFSLDGKLLISYSRDNTIRAWDVQTSSSCAVLKGHYDTILNVVFSPDGQLMASTSRDCTVRLWEMRNFKHKFSIPLLSPAHHLEFDPDFDSLVVDSNVFGIGSQGLAASRTARKHNAMAPKVAHLVSDGWVMMSSFRFLWLPPDYRPFISAGNGSTIVLALRGGPLLFLWWNRFSAS